MNEIEKQIINRYQEKENISGYYERIQKVKPNFQKMQLPERRDTEVVLTAEGPKRNYYRGRQRRFLSNRIGV